MNPPDFRPTPPCNGGAGRQGCGEDCLSRRLGLAAWRAAESDFRAWTACKRGTDQQHRGGRLPQRTTRAGGVAGGRMRLGATMPYNVKRAGRIVGSLPQRTASPAAVAGAKLDFRAWTPCHGGRAGRSVREELPRRTARAGGGNPTPEPSPPRPRPALGHAARHQRHSAALPGRLRGGTRPPA